MFGEAAFRRMKPTAYFVNTARGALVDENALARALREGWIAGAALDVFRNEPEIVGNPLLALPTVIATPHIGGITPETMRAQAWRTVEIVRELRAGRIPASSVNRGQPARWRLAAVDEERA
jgi:phosphoglycerate dehydrogenase-like enzyme